MRKVSTLLGIGLLATSITIGGIACSSDNNDNNASDTPTAVVSEGSPTASSTTPEATTAETPTVEATVEATATP